MKRIPLLILLFTINGLCVSAQNYTVFFGFNKWEITTDSQRAELTKVLSELSDQREYRVSISGSADKVGGVAINKIISLRRAQSVCDYLIKRGISKELITVKGDGIDYDAVTNGEARRADIHITLFEPEQSSLLAPQPSEVQQETTVIIAHPTVIIQQEDVVEIVQQQPTKLNRWSIGVNLGVPLFWGDMVSLSSQKTYIGTNVGVQGSYNISKSFGVSVSADWAQGKAGARGYSQSYFLSPDGMTHYTGVKATQPYSDIYSKISVVNLGVSIDLNMNSIFYNNTENHRFTVWVSPTVYGQFFNSNIYLKSSSEKFSNGETKPSSISLGLGGALSLRYRVSKNIDIQFKNSLIWITDNKFDGVITIIDNSKQNAMWTPQIGVIWNITN